MASFIKETQKACRIWWKRHELGFNTEGFRCAFLRSLERESCSLVASGLGRHFIVSLKQ